MSSFLPANILLPQNVELEKWSVIACDQYTSDAAYWQAVEKLVGQAPSTLRITLPEIYLDKSDTAQRIETINETMRKYLNQNLFKEYPSSMIHVRRELSDGTIRNGLVGMLDLEDYSFEAGSEAPIRATERTVLERIPPRVKIRENAPLELPHIMILIDDRDKTVVEPAAQKPDLPIVYDFTLMQQSGRLTGRLLDDEEKTRVETALQALAVDPVQKYGVKGKPLVYAVGDGNHSLATAKTCYETLKQTLSAEQLKNCPARYALVEIVNLHDDSLQFEPIHRAVFGVDPQKLLTALVSEFEHISLSPTPIAAPQGAHAFTLLTGEQTIYAVLPNPDCTLAVGSVQNFLDKYLKQNAGTIDYIHGEAEVRRLVAADPEQTVGILLPNMSKNDLFKTVLADGALPRKTFSMGHAQDKRFYMEARKI